LFGHCILFCRKEKRTPTGQTKNWYTGLKTIDYSVGKNEVLAALQNKRVNDFEDGIEYYAAINNKCDVLVTEDAGDFYFTGIKVSGAQIFLQEYLF
jgi:hypothetical protein